jgi:hypothetical protein
MARSEFGALFIALAKIAAGFGSRSAGASKTPPMMPRNLATAPVRQLQERKQGDRK